MEPFDLRDRPRYDLVVDRLAYWYYHPREWLKKVALMDDVYLLNSPFTFQSMEKHAAYCAMLRLGLKVPRTVLVPQKNPPDNGVRLHRGQVQPPFDLDEIAASVGYPLFMKPYDGGQWVGVSQIRDSAELHSAYDASGQRLMHLQASIEGYEVFACPFRSAPRRWSCTSTRSCRCTSAMRSITTSWRPGGRRRGAHDQPPDQRLLPLGVELLRVAGPRRRGISHRLRQRLPGRGAHEPALLLPLGDERPGRSGARSASSPGVVRAWTSTLAATSRSATATISPTPTSSPPTASWPTPTSSSTATETSASVASPHVDELVLDWITSDGVRPPAREHGPLDLPDPRARALHRALPRPDRPVGERAGRERDAVAVSARDSPDDSRDLEM